MEENKNICIFGASIIWGAYDPENGGWVTMLRNYYEEKGGRNVYNLGISGDTTEDLLKRIETEAFVREPGMIIFGIGINDSQFLKKENRNQVFLEKFKSNLKELLSIGYKFTDKIIFIGLTNVDNSKVSIDSYADDHLYKSEFVEEYNNTLKEFCDAEKIPFLNVFDLLDKNDLEDGLHPNSQGHKKLFNKIRDFLEDKIGSALFLK